jgi:hypothetical protein
VKIKPSDVKAGMQIRCRYLGDGTSFYTVQSATVRPWIPGTRNDLIITVDGLLNRWGNPEHVFSLNTRIDLEN